MRTNRVMYQRNVFAYTILKEEHMIKKYFSAGNTTRGFVNYFDDAINTAEAKKLIYIKGGSGVGKSTLMKDIAKKAVSLGLDINEIYCSSDASSLDAVVIPSINTAVFDATSPHSKDPEYPVMNGKIFDLAEFLDEDKLLPAREEIVKLIALKKSAYASMYDTLSSVSGIEKCMTRQLEIDAESIGEIERELLDTLKSDAPTVPVRGFLKAIAPNGVIDITNGITASKKKILISSEYPAVSRDVITKVSKVLELFNLSHERYYSIFDPNSVETLATKNFVLTSSPIEKVDIIYDLESAIKVKNKCAYTRYSDILSSLLLSCEEEIKLAKSYHGDIEGYYSKAMDFNKATRKKRLLLDELFD